MLLFFAQQTCLDDGDCLQGQFCHFKLGTSYCKACISCSDYRRQESGRSTCHKNWKECGKCQPGYWEEPLTGGRVRDRCLPREQLGYLASDSPAATGTVNDVNVFNLILYVLIGVVSCSVVIGGLAFLGRHVYNQRKRANVCPSKISYFY